MYMYKLLNIVTCRVVHATNKTDSSSNDWIYYYLGYTLSLNYKMQAIQLYRWFTHFPVHRCTRTKILSFR
jgi:hypothetical protein